MDVHGRYAPLVTQWQELHSVPALLWNKHVAFQQEGMVKLKLFYSGSHLLGSG